jgi:hypothetical protein
MRPAFASTKSAAAFALLLLVLLALPVVMGKNLLPPRDEVYASQSFNIAPFPWLRQQIFHEKGDIDIAFVGSSHMLHAIDTPYVQQKLTEKLGRPAVVRSICWGGAGFDILYLITKDLVTHRRVHLLIFYDEDGGKGRNPVIPVLFRYADNVDALAGLPVADKGILYLASIVGMPRNLLMLFRQEIPAEMFSAKPNEIEKFFNAPNPALRLGTVAGRLGYTSSLSYADGFSDFIRYTPPVTSSQVASGDFIGYEPSNQSEFNFSNPALPTWQVCFARKFAAVAQANGCQLVLLHLPSVEQMRSQVICEREFWPQVMQARMFVAGIPEAKLFAGLSNEEVYKLYFNPVHLNQNGQEYFTKCITPGLLKIYETSTNH